MSRIRANKITNKLGTGAVELEKGAHIPVGMGLTGAGGLNISGIVTASAADIDDFLDVGSNIKLGNAGVITATSFVGSGAALTGIDATAIKDSAGNVKVQAQASGAVYTGIHTFSGNVSIGGTLTYEDVTNIDSVGLITARNGVSISSGGLKVLGGGSNFNANITGTATTALSVTAADESSDTSCNVLFATAATGNIAPKTGSNLTFNSSSGALTATSFSGDGSGLTGLAVGLTTEALVKTNGQTASLDLSKDDHKVTATGTVTIDVTGGSEGGSHSLRIENSGSSSIGFSTYFKFPSGATPSIPSTSGAISLISFTVHKVGSVGIATVLLAGASVNFS